MSPIPHTWPIVGLVALSLTLPAMSLAQTSNEREALPVIESIATPGGQPAAARPTDNKTTNAADGRSRSPAEQVANIRHKLSLISIRLNRQANQTDKRLAQQTQRITLLQQRMNRLHKQLQQLQQMHPDIADAADGDASADSADTKAQPKASDAEHTAAADSCPSDQADRLAFDVFYQASTDAELADARHAVQANNVDDWFVLPELERLYVGRYGTCQLARRRQAHVHERTGLALRIDAVQPAPDAGENADTAAAHHNNAAATTAEADAPFHIVGVEQRGRQTYLGLATATPTQPGDITWLQPGQVYYGWYLEAVHTYAGTASFAVDGQIMTVALPE